jgi:type 1 glutamine amidotransferase
MTKSNISLFSLLLFINFCFSQDELPSLEGKNVLVVYGGYEEHRPEIFAKKITSWLEDQRAVVRLEKGTAIYKNTSVMQKLDLVIQHITMSEMTTKESQGLIKAIASGVGLAGCHGGLGDSFRDNTEYQYMVGGQFVETPRRSGDLHCRNRVKRRSNY